MWVRPWRTNGQKLYYNYIFLWLWRCCVGCFALNAAAATGGVDAFLKKSSTKTKCKTKTMGFMTIFFSFSISLIAKWSSSFWCVSVHHYYIHSRVYYGPTIRIKIVHKIPLDILYMMDLFYGIADKAIIVFSPRHDTTNRTTTQPHQIYPPYGTAHRITF